MARERLLWEIIQTVAVGVAVKKERDRIRRVEEELGLGEEEERAKEPVGERQAPEPAGA